MTTMTTTTTLCKKLIWLCLTAAAFAATAAATNATDILTHQDYFGGSNHEAYLEWWETAQKNYTGSAYFAEASADTSKGAAVHWRVGDDEMLHIAVAARATGWLAFGIGEAGGMKGADVVIYQESKPGELLDAYVLDANLPLMDECHDWKFVASLNTDDFLIFEAKRMLDTGDTQDRKIINDANLMVPAQRVITAWGDTDTYQYHGTSRAIGALRWYSSTEETILFREKMTAEADGYIDMFKDNWEVRPVETAYEDFCWDWRDFVASGQVPPDVDTIYVIGAELISDPEGGKYVHHADLLGTTDLPDASKACRKGGVTYDHLVYSYAKGNKPFVMPDEVGYKIGPGDGGGGLQAFTMAVHYDNPALVAGVTDSGGLRVHYSLKPRAQELAIMPLGDLRLKMRGMAIDPGVSQVDFSCPGQCSQIALIDKPVTVVREVFHMHGNGAAAVQEQIRDGKVIRRSQIEFWDFNMDGAHHVRQEPFEILPGDAFRTKCYYSTTDADGGVVFGKGSADEMCQVYLVYYNSIRILGGISPWGCIMDVPFSACNATMSMIQGGEARVLDDFRSFGSAPDQCAAGAGKYMPTSGASIRRVQPYGLGIALLLVPSVALFYF